MKQLLQSRLNKKCWCLNNINERQLICREKKHVDSAWSAKYSLLSPSLSLSWLRWLWQDCKDWEDCKRVTNNHLFTVWCLDSDGSERTVCVWEWLCESFSVTICGVSAPMALTGRVGLCCRERERVSARHYLCSLLLRQCPLSVRAGPTHRIQTQILTQYWNNWALHWSMVALWKLIYDM